MAGHDQGAGRRRVGRARRRQSACELADDDPGGKRLSSSVRIEVRRLPHGEGLALPAYQTAHAAGLDLLAAVPEDQPLVLQPGKHAMVPTGLIIALPEGYEAQVRPR